MYTLHEAQIKLNLSQKGLIVQTLYIAHDINTELIKIYNFYFKHFWYGVCLFKYNQNNAFLYS
jgi:hypothetical protein